MIDWLKSQGDIAFLSGAALPTSVQEYKRSGESMVPCDIEIAEDVEGVKIFALGNNDVKSVACRLPYPSGVISAWAADGDTWAESFPTLVSAWHRLGLKASGTTADENSLPP